MARGRRNAGQRRAAKVKGRRRRIEASAARMRTEEIELRTAERRAAEVLGYRVTAENEHLHTAEQVAEFDALAMSFLDEDDDELEPELDDLVALVAEQLLDAVQETVHTGDPGPARELAARVAATDAAVGADAAGTGFGRTLADVVLRDWLAACGAEVAEPALAQRAVAWIAERLGPEAATAAASPAALLAAGEHASGPDDLAPMIWLCAAVAALHGGGDAQWIAEVVDAAG